jgi:hypothetical protein
MVAKIARARSRTSVTDDGKKAAAVARGGMGDKVLGYVDKENCDESAR